MAETKSGINELHILWISEGMSCDGDTVSVTAARRVTCVLALCAASPAGGRKKICASTDLPPSKISGEFFLLMSNVSLSFRHESLIGDPQRFQIDAEALGRRLHTLL